MEKDFYVWCRETFDILKTVDAGVLSEYGRGYRAAFEKILDEHAKRQVTPNFIPTFSEIK